MPDQILMEIFNEHIPYEIDMLRKAYHLTAGQRPKGVLKNALIEAFCIHARSLIDFFKCKRLRDEDVIASDFTNVAFIPEINDAVEPLKTIKIRMNKQIFHLTRDRTIVEAAKFDPGRDGPDVVNRLEKEIARFIGCVRPEFGSLKCNTQPISFVVAPNPIGGTATFRR